MNKRAEEFVNSKTSELNGLEPDKLTVIKWLTDFASDEVEAINYTHSCKSDSEQLTKRKRECECSGMSYKVKCGFKCHK